MTLIDIVTCFACKIRLNKVLIAQPQTIHAISVTLNDFILTENHVDAYCVLYNKG